MAKKFAHHTIVMGMKIMVWIMGMTVKMNLMRLSKHVVQKKVISIQIMKMIVYVILIKKYVKK